MNGKVCRRLRSIAKTKAHSTNEVTTQGARFFKFGSDKAPDIRAINVDFERGIFFQRKLHPASVKAIVKKMKKLFREKSHEDKNKFFDVLSFLLDQLPGSLGVKG